MENFKYKIIDLTHTLNSEIPSYNGDCGFSISIDTDYTDCSGLDKFRTQRINSRAGMGTHIDAPAHCFANKTTVDNISLENLVADLIVIKVDGVLNEDFSITKEEIEKFENKNGKINPNTFVAFCTGWSKYWNEPKKYRNDLKFPSVSEEVAHMLLEREIVGLGIDTLSADTGADGFPVHRAILGADKYLVENLNMLELLPPIGAKIIIMPMKICGGTEAPARIIALIKKDGK